ncbi:MAG: AAA family ATPase [Pseudomonadales bacterium]|nr:AAA family ATPase [Pseudomonadales bacterium]
MKEDVPNPAQHDAVHHSGHTLVIACPGSGKTRVLVERAINLHDATPLNHVQLVTFTREAAIEINERLRKKIGQSCRYNVSTFHAIALKQLKGTASVKKVIGEYERQALMERAMEHCISPDADIEAFKVFL